MEFFENLTTSEKDSQTSTIEDSHEKSSSKVVEKQPELRKSKRIRKVKDLGPDEIDSQLLSVPSRMK